MRKRLQPKRSESPSCSLSLSGGVGVAKHGRGQKEGRGTDVTPNISKPPTAFLPSQPCKRRPGQAFRIYSDRGRGGVCLCRCRRLQSWELKWGEGNLEDWKDLGRFQKKLCTRGVNPVSLDPTSKDIELEQKRDTYCKQRQPGVKIILPPSILCLLHFLLLRLDPI